MTDQAASDLATRETILKILTDDEVAKVSTAEGATGLRNGSEYLDLIHLERGIQTAGSLTHVNVGDVIPRNAVSAQTWQKITAQLLR
jgi:hypothetical protein